ncbi:MAG: alpha/beta hydrolase [Cyanobacteriota bacterium]|nr:alpha/beta hydrolase [Cyanobacteriota bacterium]
MNLNVKIQGQGFPLLCLHGHPGSGRAMSVFTDRLSKQFQTFAPDLRGYGKSRFRGTFEMEDHLSDLENLLDRSGIERCLLLGWSLGGILALELALRSPQRYSGLILIATAARPWSSHPRVSWLDLVYTGIAGIVNWILPGWQWNIDNLGRRSLFRYLVEQQTPATYRFLASEAVPAYLQTSKAAYSALERSLQRGYNRLSDLHRLQLPCLVLAGREDRHITARASLETARHLPHCEWYCYEGVAHLFPWEIPQTVLNDIEQWLRAHPQAVALDDPP